MHLILNIILNYIKQITITVAFHLTWKTWKPSIFVLGDNNVKKPQFVFAQIHVIIK